MIAPIPKAAPHPRKGDFLADNQLLQNRPNPFSESTIIEVELAEDVQNAQILVTNLSGKPIQEKQIEGNQIEFTKAELGTGLFLYSLVVEGKLIATKKMLVSE